MSTPVGRPRIKNENLVWVVATLTWVAMVQPATSSGGGGGTGGTVDQGLAGASPWLVTGPLTDTQLRASAVPTSVASLPLPSGAATGTKQDTGNTSLSSIDTKTPSLGQALAAASVPVILPSATITTLTPPAAISGFALEAGHLATLDTKTPSLGQALSAASVPVVLPAAQITTLTPPAAITGFALEAGHLSTIDTKTPALGQALAAASTPVVLPAAQITTLTPPAAISGFALEAGHLATIDSVQGTQGDSAWVSGNGTVVALLKKIASAGGSAVSVADGSDVAQGTTSDAAWVSGSGTVISLLKKIASAGGSAVSIADGADTAQGTTTDLSSASTVIGLLKNLKAALAGTLAVSGPLTDTQLRASAVPVSLASAPTTAVTNAGLTNLDVALSTRTKPADQQHTIIDSGTTVVTQATGTNLHVVVDTAPTTAVTGPLTDTQLRASAVPISGTVTANAGTNLNTSALALDATLTGGTQKTKLVDTGGTNVASINSNGALLIQGYQPSVIAFSGISTTGAQASQTASGYNIATVTLRTFTGTGPSITWKLQASDDNTNWVDIQGINNNSGAIGTSWTQAAALSAGTAGISADYTIGAYTNVRINITAISGTTPSAAFGLAFQTMPYEASPGAMLNGSDGTNPQLVSVTSKGTQGARGLSTQDLKDSGRNTRIFMLDTITAAPVTEALATVVQWYGNAAVAGTTTPAVVPAGKVLRLTGYKIEYQSLATVGYAVVRIRANTGGVAVLASPLVASFEAGTNSGATTTAVTGAVTMETGSFFDGIELPAGTGIGFSIAGYGPTGTLTLEGGVRFQVTGYEY